MKIKSILLAMIALQFASCSSDSDGNAPLGSYDNGVLVLNEGGAGTVTYISNDLQTVAPDIFTAENGTGSDLGQFVQSMFFDGDRAFIISNGSNKITVVNRYTFEYITTLSTGFNVPRYATVANGKAYVTNLASFFSSADDYVAVINLQDLSLGSPIAVGNYAERILTANNKIYVANGSYGSGSSLTVIDPATGSIVDTVETGVAPNSLEAKNGILYVLCSGFGADGKIVRIDLSTNDVIDEVIFPDTMANAFNLDVEGNSAYFSVGPKVYRIDLDVAIVNDTPLFDTGSDSDYIGYGFAVNGNRVYISEAAEDFSSDGSIYVYTTDGEFIDEIPAGLGPNGFYFN